MGFEFKSTYSRVHYLVRRAFQLYTDHGLKLLLCVSVQKVISIWISLLNKVLLLPKRDGYVVREILGSQMCLDVADDGISHDLIIDGIRETYHVNTLMREVKPGDVVIDIGANIGYYALLEASIVGNGGQVYAIEPVPSNAELLRKNIDLNGCSNIELYQLAIGEARKTAPMYQTPQRNLGSLLNPTGTPLESHITKVIDVEVMTLDDFLKDKPSPRIIRMDVEGYEYEIIRGMGHTLQTVVPLTILMEFHFHRMKRARSTEVLQTLRNAGFRTTDVALESRIPGRHRHKTLSRIWSLVEPTIEKELHQRPWRRHIDLSIEDLLVDPDILEGKLGNLHICFQSGPYPESSPDKN
jgi:FkbM family methyltransferase